MLRLALADIWHERVLFLCSALGCAAVLAPLIVLFGLRQGVVAGLRAELLEDPRAREIASVVVAFLRTEMGPWKRAYISHWPIRAGVRESRRWIGESVLTGDDLLNGNRFEDEIGLATWPMELRETAKGPKLRYPLDNKPCGIPLRCLKPLGMSRIFVAGRCISSDHEAQASIRVMGTCFVTGEAAGIAAAAARGSRQGSSASCALRSGSARTAA